VEGGEVDQRQRHQPGAAGLVLLVQVQRHAVAGRGEPQVGAGCVRRDLLAQLIVGDGAGGHRDHVAGLGQAAQRGGHAGRLAVQRHQDHRALAAEGAGPVHRRAGPRGGGLQPAGVLGRLDEGLRHLAQRAVQQVVLDGGLGLRLAAQEVPVAPDHVLARDRAAPAQALVQPQRPAARAGARGRVGVQPAAQAAAQHRLERRLRHRHAGLFGVRRRLRRAGADGRRGCSRAAGLRRRRRRAAGLGVGGPGGADRWGRGLCPAGFQALERGVADAVRRVLRRESAQVRLGLVQPAHGQQHLAQRAAGQREVRTELLRARGQRMRPAQLVVLQAGGGQHLVVHGGAALVAAVQRRRRLALHHGAHEGRDEADLGQELVGRVPGVGHGPELGRGPRRAQFIVHQVAVLRVVRVVEHHRAAAGRVLRVEGLVLERDAALPGVRAEARVGRHARRAGDHRIEAVLAEVQHRIGPQAGAVGHAAGVALQNRPAQTARSARATAAGRSARASCAPPACPRRPGAGSPLHRPAGRARP
jgi:hypothetical protein